jgi:hypothetical protein
MKKCFAAQAAVSGYTVTEYAAVVKAVRSPEAVPAARQ